MPQAIATTNREVFTSAESVDLARLIFKRFGRDLEAATAAWRRLLQNSCTKEDFAALLDYAEHTPHCDGYCR